MVLNLPSLNLASVEVARDFMLKHGYIKNNFSVEDWAAPEFFEQAARELIEEEVERSKNP